MKKIFILSFALLFLSGCSLQFGNKYDEDISNLKDQLSGLQNQISSIDNKLNSIMTDNVSDLSENIDINDTGIILDNIISNESNSIENFEINFIVSNQSSELDPVDIKIYIDKKLFFNKQLDWQSKNLVVGGHNYQYLKTNLTKGSHEIFIESKNGGIKTIKNVSVDKNKWFTVDYWYCDKNCNPKEPSNISFNSFDSEPGIM